MQTQEKPRIFDRLLSPFFLTGLYLPSCSDIMSWLGNISKEATRKASQEHVASELLARHRENGRCVAHDRVCHTVKSLLREVGNELFGGFWPFCLYKLESSLGFWKVYGNSKQKTLNGGSSIRIGYDIVVSIKWNEQEIPSLVVLTNIGTLRHREQTVVGHVELSDTAVLKFLLRQAAVAVAEHKAKFEAGIH